MVKNFIEHTSVVTHRQFGPFMPTLQFDKSVSKVPRNSTSILTLLSPPTQLPAAPLSRHHRQCPRRQHAATLLLPSPLTKPGPWGSGSRLFRDPAVQLSGESKLCPPTAGEPLDSDLL